MTDADKPFFGEQMKHFALVHKQALSKALVQAYWEDCKHLSRMDFEAACVHLRRTSQWMPKPNEFNAARRAGWV